MEVLVTKNLHKVFKVKLLKCQEFIDQFQDLPRAKLIIKQVADLNNNQEQQDRKKY